MKTAEDFEFEALLESVVAERVSAKTPVGLTQRLMARFEQATVQEPALRAQASISSVQFRDFGVLDDGRKSKRAFVLSLCTNISAALLVFVIGSAVKHAVAPNAKLLSLAIPVTEKAPEPKPLQPRIVPPPAHEAVTTPRTVAEVELPPDIEPFEMPEAKPSLTPPEPKAVTPPPAPKAINLANASAASIPNNDPHASPVRLGRTDSPVRSDLKGPAVSNVNLGAGMPGMSSADTGSGPPSKTVNLGNGAPSSTNLSGRSAAAVPVTGMGSGIGSGYGAGTGGGVHGAVAVQIAPQRSVTPVHPATATTLAHAPVITYTPKPVYSEEAKALHLEGDATVKVRLLANGTVEVLGLSRGLGHGLDQAALNTAKGIRFTPATDSSGKAVDFPTTVTVHFLIN